MRKLLAAALLLAATTAPATADPIADAYNLVYSQCPRVQPDPLSLTPCEHFNLYYQYDNPTACSAVNVKDPVDGSYTFIFAGASAFSPWVSEFTTLCWNENVPQWRAIQIVPGPASVMLPQRFPGMPAPNGRVCTQFKMRFVADNPWGFPAGVEYTGDTYCID